MNLKDKISTLDKILATITEQKNNCKTCLEQSIDATVFMDQLLDRFNKSDADENPFKSNEVYVPCECGFYEGKDYDYYNDQKHRLERISKTITEKIPEEYQVVDFENIDPRIKDFLHNDKIFLWICGNVGTGKTYSLYSLKAHLITQGKDIEIVKEYNFNYEMLESLKRTLFCIDDFGISENGNRNISLLENYFEIVDYKRENHSKMIITSNITIREWLEKMKKYNSDTAGRIASRLSNVTAIIEIKGEDRRKNVYKNDVNKVIFNSTKENVK